MQNYLDRIKIFEYYDKNKQYNMNIFLYTPEGNIHEMKIIFVMSGCLRDSLNYLKNWIDVANKNKYIIIAPEFDKDNYSIAEYEYGNLINIEYDFSSQDIYTPYMKYSKSIKDNTHWIYNNIDNIYLKFIKKYKLKNDGYILFGHSSGAQFVHRFLMFKNSLYCKKYLCANAGLYTFFNPLEDYPYGIRNLKKYTNTINKSLERDVYIMVGMKDLKKDNLNCLPMDFKEGKNRLERAINFFDSAQKYARENNIDFNWKLVKMKNVEHDNSQVIKFAVEIINEEV